MGKLLCRSISASYHFCRRGVYTHYFKMCVDLWLLGEVLFAINLQYGLKFWKKIFLKKGRGLYTPLQQKESEAEIQLVL